jgi:hypothetical protein
MINVDAAIFETENCMGLGFIIRNHRGDFLAAVRQGFDKITNPEMEETIDFRHAVQFALQLPHNKLLVASDCLPLINKLQRQIVDRSHTVIIIEDIKKLRRALSVGFSFIHVSRSCNQVAHALAKSASYLNDFVWYDVPLDFICTKLCNDLCS